MDTSDARPRSTPLRILTLGISSLLCAAVTGLGPLLVSFCVRRLLLPETGEVTQLTLLEVVADPAVWIAWCFWVLAGGAIGFALSLWTLWRVDLKKAVPLIGSVAVATTVLFSPFGPLAFFPALFAGCTAILWCRRERRFRLGSTSWRSPRRAAAPSTSRGGTVSGLEPLTLA